MDYLLTIKIPIDAENDDKARKTSIHILKWLSILDGTVTLYEIVDNKPVRRVLVKEKK